VIWLSLYSLSEIPEERVTDKLYRKMIVGKRVMLAQIILKKGCVVVSHRHESEQMTFVVKGLLELTLPNGKVRVGKIKFLLFPRMWSIVQWRLKILWTLISSVPLEKIG